MKKIIAMLLALMIVMSLGTTAFAATHDSITINKAKVGEEYKLYKMFDLVVDKVEDPKNYSYTVNSAWTSFFAAGGAGAQYITVKDGYVTNITDAAALAKAAANWTGKPGALKTVEATSESVLFDDLENGYYLITSTLGTFAMTETTPDKAEVTITEKNPVDTIIKKVKEDSTGEYGDENDAQVGDTVEFKSTVTLNKGTRNVVVHDAMDAGLTLNQNSIAIAGLTEGTQYTVAFNTTDGCDFEIIFKQDYLDGLTAAQTVLTLTYTAVLNEGAVVKNEHGVVIVDQYNKTKITYGNKQSVEDETKTTTHKVIVNKYADKVENLAGAVFKLKKANNVVMLIKIDELNYRVAKAGETGAVDSFTTVATGDVVIWGLDTDKDYTLEEVTPPAGYNKLPNDVSVTVNADNSTKIDVENESGTELPTTGGIGTTIFYILGAALMIGAAVLLITKRRMNIAD